MPGIVKEAHIAWRRVVNQEFLDFLQNVIPRRRPVFDDMHVVGLELEARDKHRAHGFDVVDGTVKIGKRIARASRRGVR
jgi:hypothetical protein